MTHDEEVKIDLQYRFLNPRGTYRNQRDKERRTIFPQELVSHVVEKKSYRPTLTIK